MAITTLSIISAEAKREQTRIAIAIKEEERRREKERALATLFEEIKSVINKTEDSYCCSYLIATHLLKDLKIDLTSEELKETIDIILTLLNESGYHAGYSTYCESTTRKTGKLGLFYIDWKEEENWFLNYKISKGE